MIKKEYEKFLKKVQKPARYTGGEYNEVLKDKAAVDIRYALCFPDAYEIGMSNLGVKILYGVLNNLDYVWCERAYAPLEDMAAELRAAGLPLYALESCDPLGEFDFLGFSLQYELCYTNVLYILDLAGIPFRAADRDENYPILMAGGPCAYNPEPTADFFDIFAIGEGEEVIAEIMALYRAHKKSGSFSKENFLFECARLEGVYVPRFYKAEYSPEGILSSFAPVSDALPGRIRKRIINDFNSAYFPCSPPIPAIDIVQDRIMLEVFRGCIRGCRFCQAGFIFRPVREKSAERLCGDALDSFKNTGYNEISLSSLSISDYTELAALTERLTEWTDKKKVSLSLPSMRIDAFSEALFKKTSSVRQSTLTFAPEAGSQRMRDRINKNLTEAEILDTMRIAFRAGKESVKLYFMIGLPGEEDSDIIAIAELAKKVIDCYYEVKAGRKGGRGVSVTISVATFVPKCHTPFCFEPQDSFEEINRKQKLLKSAITSRKISYNYHEAKISKLEAVFARGDRRLSNVIETAYKNGALFDGWDEKYKYDVWLSAFAENGLTMEQYAERRYGYADLLPWDFIDTYVDRDFLVSENRRAAHYETTPNCREFCSQCGADCGLGIGNRS